MAKMKALTVDVSQQLLLCYKIASWQPTKHGLITVTQKWSISLRNTITKFYLGENIKNLNFSRKTHNTVFRDTDDIIPWSWHHYQLRAHTLKQTLSFMKLVYHWKNCTENGDDYVKNQMQVIKMLISRIIFLLYLLNYSYLWYQRHCFS